MAIRIRKMGHSHKLTVPTTRKGIGLSQAGKQVAQSKATLQSPGASMIPYDGGQMYGSGGTIHINPKNKGKFTATKKATGKTTEALTHSSNATTRKRAIFAQNARKWHHHPNGGWIEEYGDGGEVKSYNPNMAKKDKDFQKWYTKNTLEGQNKIPYSDSLNYDYYSYFKNGSNNGNIEDHFPDTFKRPTHPTFSNESIYSTPEKPGGQWDGENYNPKGKFQYRTGGRTINPAMGGLMIGGQHAYPPTVQYPPEYGLGGIMQGIAPFANLLNGVVPGLGLGVSAGLQFGGKALEDADNKKDQQSLNSDKAQQAELYNQNSMKSNGRPTFAWGGRLPESNSFSPSGLTMGHVPGYDSNSNPGVPPKGFSFRTNTVGREGEIKNWSQDTMMNVQRHKYPQGGVIDLSKKGDYSPTVWNGDMYDYMINKGLASSDTLSRKQWSGYSKDKVNNFVNNSGGALRVQPGISSTNPWGQTFLSNNKYKGPMQPAAQIGGGNALQQYQADLNPDGTYTNTEKVKYPMGGEVDEGNDPTQTPVQLEKQEVYQTPDGDMGQVNAPSHEQGGINMQLPANSFVWSDKLKTRDGQTFADKAAKLARMKAKYEKILKG